MFRILVVILQTKTKIIMRMKHLISFLLALVALSVLPCKGENTKPSQYITDPQKLAMLNSLEDLDSARVMLMNYTVDYRLDDMLKANVASLDSFNKALVRLLYDVQPSQAKKLTFSTGCSAYAAQLKDSGQYLMGRNLDICHKVGDQEVPTTALVLFTNPKHGKKSINFVDPYWLGLTKGFYSNGTDISTLMFAPYLICDGMNEDGLAISVLYLDGSAVEQTEAGKPDIFVTTAMRGVLDLCGTVDSAINFLRSYNMHAATAAGGNLHFMLADSLGKHAVVEWSFADPMHVDSATIPTVFTPLQEDTNRYVTNFYVDPRLKDCKFGGNSQHGRDRYNTLRDTLKAYDYILTLPQSKSLLAAVAQSPNPEDLTSHTQWSNVYNLSKRTVECAVLQKYERWFEFSVTGKMPTALDDVQGEEPSLSGKKVMINGQLYILRGNTLYNALGMVVE